MAKDNECSKYTGLSYYIPRKNDLKRAYLLLTNGDRLGISSNKKQAIEAAMNKPNILLRSVYPLDKHNVSLGTDSSLPSILGQVQGGLVLRSSPSLYVTNMSLGTDGMSNGRKDFGNAGQVDAIENARSLANILKAKVNCVLNSEIVPIRSSLRRVYDGRLMRTIGSNKYYDSFLAFGLPYHGNNTPMNVIRNEGLQPRLTLGGNNYVETNRIVSGKASEGLMKDVFRMAIAENKAIVDYGNFTHLSGATNQTNIIKPNACPDGTHGLVVYHGGCNAHQMLSFNNMHKGDGIISGGAKVTTNGEATADNQNSARSSGANARFAESNLYMEGSAEKYRAHANIGSLSNKYLLSTGVFDGAPVKYTLRSRNIILQGIIKGSKILCSCNECDNSKYITPNKFERHAGGNSKKPYSHIYLENGKSINRVSRELEATPKGMLFHLLPEIAGSAFGWQSFNNWKGPSS